MAARKTSARTKTRSSSKSRTKSKSTTRAKSGGAKSSSRRDGKKSGEKVERAMHEMKHGKLRSGRSGKKVTSRKQAIAIGLSEARAKGAKVPKKPTAKKTTTKKTTRKRATEKKR